MNRLFNLNPLIIAALHVPHPPPDRRAYPISWLEDYVLENMRIFVSGGIPAVILQDQTPATGSASAETIARMAALGRVLRREYPQTELGIIVKAHDPIAPLAIADACDASFVRIKVFVGAMLKAEGILQGCGTAAEEHRRRIGRTDIAILADVYDRTGVAVVEAPIERVAQWAARTGADGIILTGSNYKETLAFLERVRQSGLKVLLLSAGGANSENISELLRYADGIVVSTALMQDPSAADDLARWDPEKVARFMERARQARAQQP